eukprot:378083-Pleurochrysis_carterae.AAC.1
MAVRSISSATLHFNQLPHRLLQAPKLRTRDEQREGVAASHAKGLVSASPRQRGRSIAAAPAMEALEP